MPKPTPPNVIPDFSPDVDDARRFALGRQPVAPELPSVVCGGWELGAPHYRMERGGTQALAVEFLLSGQGTLDLQGREVALVPGTVFSYGPGIPHRIIPAQGSRLSKYFLNTDGERALALMNDHGLAPGSVRRVADTAPLKTAFDLLIDLGIRGGAAAPGLCGHLAATIFALVEAHSAPSAAMDLAGFATFQRACGIMEERHEQVATVEAIADACGITTVYLCRLFGQYAQETPLQHLTRRRMRRAAELLESGLPAREVAARLNFADQFHFSRCFRRVYGASPRSYLALVGRRAGDSST